MYKRKLFYIYNLLILFSLLGCTQQTQAQAEPVPNEPSIKIDRFDIELDNYLKEPNTEKETLLKNNYPDFLSAFGVVTINRSNINDAAFFPTINRYFSNEMLSKIYNDALSAFANVQTYEEELSKADELIKANMDNKHLPNLGLHISGFKENTIVLENYISISIDKYLGQDYPMYNQFFEKYQLLQMQPKMITRDFIRAWIISEKKNNNKKKNLLDEIIDEGKVLYTLSVLLPDWQKYDLLGYTDEQLQWCTTNEIKIWKVVVQKNYLFSNDYLLIDKFVQDAPYTAPVSVESPGRLGAWIGWQIVDKYMKNNSLKLTELMNTDSSKILKDSKYNPQS